MKSIISEKISAVRLIYLQLNLESKDWKILQITGFNEIYTPSELPLLDVHSKRLKEDRLEVSIPFTN